MNKYISDVIIVVAFLAAFITLVVTGHGDASGWLAFVMVLMVPTLR